MSGWIGVDLDGTLADDTDWRGPTHVGPPIPRMVERIKEHLALGNEVRIVTARAGLKDFAVTHAIQQFSLAQFGEVLAITDRKDFDMRVLYDDRAVGVIRNTGILRVRPSDEDLADVL